MSARPLKIGLLIDSRWNSRYVYDFALWAQSQSMLSISHLIVHHADADANGKRNVFHRLWRIAARDGLYGVLSKIVFALVTSAERFLIDPRRVHYRDHYAAFDLTEVVTESLTVTPRISASGLSYRFSDEDVQRVKDLDLDVLIRCGGAILRGGILGAARLGILSFHHADNRINRGVPAGFWEVVRKQPTTGFVIQQLTEELDGGNILVRGAFPTRQLYLLNRMQLFEKSNGYLKRLIADIAVNRRLPPFLPDFPYSEPLYRSPEVRDVFWYAAGVGRRVAARVARKVTRRDYRWAVSYIFANWRKAVLWRATDIPNPPGRFLADPFVIRRNGRHYCFLEDYDCSARKERIAAYELSRERAEPLGVVIDEPFHLSFPFIFEYDGQLYICPESSNNRDIRLYRCVDFPLHWVFDRVLMSDVDAADTMIVKAGGRWWMFTNIDPADVGDHGSELFLFHAQTPLADRWVAHPRNPVIADALVARNAGMIVEDETLYRFSQRQGFPLYGSAVNILKILVLSEEDYQEEAVGAVLPRFKEGIIGTHHLHADGDVTVFDHMRVAGI